MVMQRARFTEPPRSTHNLWFKADQLYATIEKFSGGGWTVKVWTSEITAYHYVCFTRRGARRKARRELARERLQLTRKIEREVIR